MRKTQRNMTRQSVLVGLAIVLLSCSVTAMASGLQAWLNRTQTGEGQSVVLYLMAQADAVGEPDLSPLRVNFDVANIVQSSHVQLLNGQPSNIRTWQVTLAPKHPGRLTVPALSVGQATSAPLVLEVFPAEQVFANRVLRDVMLQTDVSTQWPYVQGKVIYTVRLYTRVDLHQVRFSEPEISNTIVERLGEDKKYVTYFQRYRYSVLQRRYVLFPQRSGHLSVTSPLLSAEVWEKRRPHRPLQMRGPQITLDVQAPPDPTLKPWLPAESLSLSETWSPDPPSFRVGEPVNRSIAITAQGVAAAQLPDLPQSAPQGINLYPELPVSSMHASGNTLVTKKVWNYALVATRAGNYRLPAISVTWWDTTTGKRKTEAIPARDIVVLPGAAPVKDKPQPATSTSFWSDLEPFWTDLKPGAWWQSARKVWEDGSKIWPWLALLLALAWLTRMIVRWRGRRTRSSAAPSKPAPAAPATQSAGNALRRFESACRQKDPHLARKALIDWANATWPDDPPQRLDRLAKRLPPQAGAYLAEIDRVLYAASGEAWDGTTALAALKPLLQDAAKDQGPEHDTQALPPLYPG